MSSNPGVGTKDLQRVARYDRVELREGFTIEKETQIVGVIFIDSFSVE